MLYDKKWDKQLETEGETVELLKRARAMVEHRWCPWGATDDKGGVCVIVALGGAAKYPNGNDYELARKYFRDAIPIPNTLSIPEWNDHPGRTQADVLAAFDRAIALARRDA
jgi:hypothetical protein